MKRALVYDDETGFAHELDALFAPITGKAPKKTHRYSSAITKNTKWKGHNEQFCIVCREGGEVLCCEECPASFHLLCHTPPILSVPPGKFECNRCAQLPPTVVKGSYKLNPSLKERESEADRNEIAVKCVFDNATEEEKDDPIKLMAKASCSMNTQVFALPDEYQDKTILPDSDRSEARVTIYGERCTACGKKMVQPLIDGAVTDLNEVAEPTKFDTLYPMIACDFCDRIYHLDCIDYPMTLPAKKRWMCPQHPEHILDKNCLKTNSLTKRLHNWKHHARQEIDDLEIQQRFSDRISEERKGPETVVEESVRVPIAIKKMYTDRVDGNDQIVFPSEESKVKWMNNIVSVKAIAASVEANIDVPKIEDNIDMKKECLIRMNRADGIDKILYSLAYSQLQSLESDCIVLDDSSLSTTAIDQSRIHTGLRILGVVAKEGNTDTSYPIQRLVTNIGKDKDADICLSSSSCLTISRWHASLVFDKVAQRFDIIPLEINTIRVDGVVYGMSRNTVDPKPYPYRCSHCDWSKEGRVSQGAQLRHGSIIEIGCERFVFASFF